MKSDWSQFLKNLASLIKVKTIITLVVIAVFATLALNGTLEPDVVMSVVTMVVAFYFGTQKERQDAPLPPQAPPEETTFGAGSVFKPASALGAGSAFEPASAPGAASFLEPAPVAKAAPLSQASAPPEGGSEADTKPSKEASTCPNN